MRDLAMTTDNDARLKKLKFRAWHRGFREADLILGPFADSHGPSLSEADLTAFETLLQQPDHDIYGWILEREPTPAAFDGPIMRQLKLFRDQAHKHIGPRGVGNG